MKKLYVVPLLFAFLVGCSACGGVLEGKCDQKLVLKVSREFRREVMYVVCADGSGTADYELPLRLGDYPDWSPDGEWVAYQMETKCKDDQIEPQIFVQNLETKKEYKITDVCSGAENPHWSQDGNQIIYDGRGVEVVDVSCIYSGGECVFEPESYAQHYSPSWRPDGNGEQIVFEMYNPTLISHHLMVMDLAHPENVFELNPPDTNSCCYPNWSPTANKIVALCRTHNKKIYVFDLEEDSSHATPLGITGQWPTWSPNGEKIAFSSIDLAEDLGKCVRGDCSLLSMALFVMNADGTDVTRVSFKENESVLWFSWLP